MDKQRVIVYTPPGVGEDRNRAVITGPLSGTIAELYPEECTESHIGFDATVLDAALKDTGCPLSVGELLDLMFDGLESRTEFDADSPLGKWILRITDQIDTEPEPESA